MMKIGFDSVPRVDYLDWMDGVRSWVNTSGNWQDLFTEPGRVNVCI